MTSVEETVRKSREAQAGWANLSVAERLRPIRALRYAVAADPFSWAESIHTPQARTRAESLAGEILPLADGCRWLEKEAATTLQPRQAGGWLGGISLRVERKPHGVVLVIGASNYPLMLLAAPALQALVAGNAIVLKSPPGAEAVAEQLHKELVRAGVDPRLCPVLDSSVEAAKAAIGADVDYIVATGSSNTGRAVARGAAEQLTPCTLECSGSDAVIVLPGADLQRAADCIAWGLLFNSAATCIGPRRLIVVGDQADRLQEMVIDRLRTAPACQIPDGAAESVRGVLHDELEAGSQFVLPTVFSHDAIDQACDARQIPPVVLTSARDPSLVSQHDIFAPILALDRVASVEQAIEQANQSPYALGASVFGPAEEAGRVASRLRAGCVTVNDLLAPTADPRVCFGGTGESGYGVTRGPEGLLSMTRPQAIITRRGRWLPHLDAPTPALEDLIAGMIQTQHAAGWAARWRGLRKLIAAAISHRKCTKTNKTA